MRIEGGEREISGRGRDCHGEFLLPSPSSTFNWGRHLPCIERKDRINKRESGGRRKKKRVFVFCCDCHVDKSWNHVTVESRGREKTRKQRVTRLLPY